MWIWSTIAVSHNFNIPSFYFIPGNWEIPGIKKFRESEIFRISGNLENGQKFPEIPDISALAANLHIPSTLNIDYLLWHTELIVYAVKYQIMD